MSKILSYSFVVFMTQVWLFKNNNYQEYTNKDSLTVSRLGEGEASVSWGEYGTHLFVILSIGGGGGGRGGRGVDGTIASLKWPLPHPVTTTYSHNKADYSFSPMMPPDVTYTLIHCTNWVSNILNPPPSPLIILCPTQVPVIKDFAFLSSFLC